jgi:hypothetical protein
MKKKLTGSKRARCALRTSRKNKAKTAKKPTGKISGPTLVAFLLDETGSMMSCKQATISGFNEYIQTLKNTKQDINFTLTKFNSMKSEIVHDCVELKDVKELNDQTYIPDNGTPLYDAIGSTIRSTEKNKESKKRKILVVIQTDGEENASKEFSRQNICDLIKEKEKAGWTFVFLGANIDAYQVANSIGVKASNTANYSTAKTGHVFRSMALATGHYGSTGQQGVASDCFYASAGVDVKSFVDEDEEKKKVKASC